eukprot:SAG31_NODE_31011_length_373_cov_1.120438_1_plen_77_part_00
MIAQPPYILKDQRLGLVLRSNANDLAEQGSSRVGQASKLTGSYRVTLSRLAPGFSVRIWEIQQEKSHKNEKVTLLT